MSGLNPFSDNDQRTSKGAFIPPKVEKSSDPHLEIKELQDERFLNQRLNEAEDKGREERERLLRGECHDPTQAARMNGHEPSRGAIVDQDLAQADREYLKNKGKI